MYDWMRTRYIYLYNYYAQRPLLTYKHYWLLLAAGCCSAAPVVIVQCFVC